MQFKVQIHNEKLFGGSLSVALSAGPVGVSVDVSGSHTPYKARHLLLFA